MFNELGEFGLNQVLARRLTTSGPAPAPTVEPALFPALTLENDRPEWGYAKGELRAGVAVSVSAVAAQYSSAQLYLPSTANTIVVVQSIISKTSATFFMARLVGISGSLAGWAAVNTATTDFRWAAQRTGAILERVNNVAQPTVNQNIANFNTLGQQHTAPIIIVPGTALGFYAQAVNTTISFDIVWYERAAQPGELV